MATATRRSAQQPAHLAAAAVAAAEHERLGAARTVDGAGETACIASMEVRMGMLYM